MTTGDWQEIIDFWFGEITEQQWFKQDDEFDRQVEARFLGTWQAAARQECAGWRGEIEGRLAEIIVLDQFPRNMFRGSARAFATDDLALSLSQEALAAPGYANLESRKKAFLLMPFMHSESAAAHEQALQLFSEPGLESNLDFEKQHKAIIDRFGRYPHRNAALGRESTPEELQYLAEGGKTF